MGLDPVQPIYQKAFSEVQNSKSFHYGGTGGTGSLAGTGPTGSVQYGMDRPYPPTGIMRVPEFSISQSQHNIQQNSIDHQRIMFLEQKMQRLEQDNHILYQQNAKMKNQYTQGLNTIYGTIRTNFQSLRSYNLRIAREPSGCSSNFTWKLLQSRAIQKLIKLLTNSVRITFFERLEYDSRGIVFIYISE